MEERISTRKRRENEAVENGAENVIAFSILEITAIVGFVKMHPNSREPLSTTVGPPRE